MCFTVCLLVPTLTWHCFTVEASRWINASHRTGAGSSRARSTSPVRTDRIRDVSPLRDVSPVRNVSPTRGSARSIRTIDHAGIPENFRNDYSRSEAWQNAYQAYGDTTPEKGYPTGTWNGRNAGTSEVSYNTTGGRGKQAKKGGKKWYHFGMKHNVQKSKSGKENRGYRTDYDYPYNALPLSHQDSATGNYSSSSRRHTKSDGDVLDADTPGIASIAGIYPSGLQHYGIAKYGA